MTGSKQCDWVSDALPEYLAGRLPQADGERVRSHLEGCAECRNRANAVSLLQQTPVPRPDPNRWEGFVAGVVEETDRRRGRFVRWLVAAAVIVLLLAGGELIRRGLFGPGSGEDAGIEMLARDIAGLSEIEAAAWTAGIAPEVGIPVVDGSEMSEEELEELLTEVGRT